MGKVMGSDPIHAIEVIRLQCHWQWQFHVDFGEISLLK